jgi:cytochrome c oxidase subunit 1
MLVFMLGGATGIINASYTVNKVVHNTAYIPGHFHLTVGTAVALSIMGISYWLVPFLTGRALFSPGTARIQPWLYVGGVLLFSLGQIQGGLRGMPRRTQIDQAAYLLDEWEIWNRLAAVGGVLMVISGLLFFYVIGGTLLISRTPATVEDVPMAETHMGPRDSWIVFDRLAFWFLVAVILVALAYGPVFIDYLPWNGTAPGIEM